MIAGWPGYVGVYWKGDSGLGLDAEGANEQDVAKKLLFNQGKKVVAYKDKPGLHLLYRAASNKELEHAAMATRAIFTAIKILIQVVLLIILATGHSRAQSATAKTMQAEMDELRKQVQVQAVEIEGLNKQMEVLRNWLRDELAHLQDLGNAMNGYMTANESDKRHLEQQILALQDSVRSLEANVAEAEHR